MAGQNFNIQPVNYRFHSGEILPSSFSLQCRSECGAVAINTFVRSSPNPKMIGKSLDEMYLRSPNKMKNPLKSSSNCTEVNLQRTRISNCFRYRRVRGLPLHPANGICGTFRWMHLMEFASLYDWRIPNISLFRISRHIYLRLSFPFPDFSCLMFTNRHMKPQGIMGLTPSPDIATGLRCVYPLLFVFARTYSRDWWLLPGSEYSYWNKTWRNGGDWVEYSSL